MIANFVGCHPNRIGMIQVMVWELFSGFKEGFFNKGLQFRYYG
jgi:hypothetical protein